MKIRIDLIRKPQRLMRKVVNETALESLARSIRRIGIIQPLIVRKNGDEYELVAGMRRLMAAEMVGLSTVPATIMKIDPDDAEAVKIAENHERESVNPIDEGEYFADVLAATGWTQKEMAVEVGVSEAYISQRMATATWDARTKQAVRGGNMKFSVARELEKVVDVVEKKRLVEVAIVGGVTPAVAAQWRREVNTAIEARNGQADLELKRTPQSLPQKVYVACQTCEAPIEVEKVVFLRICPDCNKTIKTTP